MKMRLNLLRLQTGVTIVELLISSAITAVLASVLAVGLFMTQKSFLAAQHYAKSQCAQLRILDYIALDLRRSLSVTPRSDGGLDLTIPDYYVSSNPKEAAARNPTIDDYLSTGLGVESPSPIVLHQGDRHWPVIRADIQFGALRVLLVDRVLLIIEGQEALM